ncbi:MAG: hypothetical protein ACJ8FS_04050 [Sphingomicrobium sp.]
MSMQGQDQSQQTGTQNETYNVISILYHALQGAENCQTYLQDAQDGQIRDFIQQALQLQRQLADQGKEVLQQCLQNDTGGSSAFGWGQSQGQSGMSGQSQSGFGGQSQSAFGEQGGGQSQSNFADQGAGEPSGESSF